MSKELACILQSKQTLEENTPTTDARSGSGKDYVESGSGKDYVESGSGKDYVESGSGKDYVESGSGKDYVESGTGKDCVETISKGASGSDIGIISKFGLRLAAQETKER